MPCAVLHPAVDLTKLVTAGNAPLIYPGSTGAGQEMDESLITALKWSQAEVAR